MGDVWIDIGSYRGGKPDYWTDASKPFQWMIGANERNSDLQQAKGLQGSGLGFYTGIDANRTIEASDLTTTALALYAMLKVDQIGVAASRTQGSAAQATTSTTTSTSITTSTSTTAFPTGISTETIAIIAVVAAIVIALAVVLTRRRGSPEK
jgi:predicted S18 family serine protease